MNPLIVIPCFNDNAHLKGLVKKIQSLYSLNILILDDGSVEPVCQDDLGDKVFIVRNEVNRGKGYSLKKAFNYAHDNNYTHAVTIDADLQHDPIFIKDFLSIDGNVNIVIGRRKFDSSMPLLRRLSNKTTSFIASKMAGHNIQDSQSGYRRYKVDMLIFKSCIEDGFQFETEVIIDILRAKKAELEHVPISTVYNNEKSSINNTLDTYKFIKMILRKIVKR